MADTGIDYESLFRNRIDSMLLAVSWIDQVKEMLGLEAVSQIWGDKPAWYVWISGAQGVYELQLDEAYPDEFNGEIIKGMFSIKCYPYPEDEVLHAFSLEEQDLIRSRFFDDTHTPRFEEKEDIPDPLFKIAALEYEVNQEDSTVCLTFDSLSTWRSVYKADTSQESGYSGKSDQRTEDEIGRSVPGWKLGAPFFDRLLSMYAFYSKTKPMRIRITLSPGFEYEYNDGDHPVCVDSSDVHYYSASVAFGLPEKGSACADGEPQNTMEAQADSDGVYVVVDRSFHCGHYHAREGDETGELLKDMGINELWWSLADAEYQCELASTCGCH